MPWSIWFRAVIVVIVVTLITTASQLIGIIVISHQPIIRIARQIGVDWLLRLFGRLFGVLCGRRRRHCCTCWIIQGCIHWARCRWAKRAVAWWRVFRRMWKCWIEVWERWSRRWDVWGIVHEHILIWLLMRCDRCRCSWIILISLICVVWLIWWIWCATCRRRFCTQFTLCDETLQMWHETKSQWILNIHALDCDEISRHLRCALTETNNVIFHSESLRVESIDRVDSCVRRKMMMKQLN